MLTISACLQLDSTFALHARLQRCAPSRRLPATLRIALSSSTTKKKKKKKKNNPMLVFKSPSVGLKSDALTTTETLLYVWLGLTFSRDKGGF